ncbi:hypothetical protein ES703_02726 [subsurface metagenome]
MRLIYYFGLLRKQSNFPVCLKKCSCRLAECQGFSAEFPLFLKYYFQRVLPAQTGNIPPQRTPGGIKKETRACPLLIPLCSCCDLRHKSCQVKSEVLPHPTPATIKSPALAASVKVVGGKKDSFRVFISLKPGSRAYSVLLSPRDCRKGMILLKQVTGTTRK